MLTLINSVITAMPMYMMSVYKMPEKIRKKIDSYRSSFLWMRNLDNRKKYALVRWKKVCQMKKNDGLGVLDIKDMNVALLMKWWWRYKSPSFASLWKSLIQLKYNGSNNRSSYSPFWKMIRSLDSLGRTSSSYTVGDGSSINFWQDIWYNNCSLATLYPFLYDLCANKDCSLQEVVLTHGSILHFSRSLNGILRQEWHELTTILHNTCLKNEDDTMNWRWETNGIYTSHSLYQFLNFGGVPNHLSNIWWELKVPVKIQVFMWLVMHDKILSKHNLSKKGWPGDVSCCCCGDVETTTHLFLFCPIIKTVWFWLGNCQNEFYKWQSLPDIVNFAARLRKKNKHAFLTCFSALCWGMWNMRNEIIFNNRRAKTTRNLLILIQSYVEYWTGLTDEETKQYIKNWLPQDWNEVPIQMQAPEAPIGTMSSDDLWRGWNMGQLVEASS
ncbi:RNA-directed DNA polymerase (reverse transcriptase)-related family protein [Rhynchospora pubera]|uniref:RNA-directed DNA polymerase (Reverse transcriptase)-related family protein n=1 Tax=Rhynchospora pubera TaxID=906938 RepID=A0AAV8GLE1_9POAL|nr:RNA-directed DNA polymerase (reverse transcriptase)-related family protein [Rhynchospora pubera]